MTITLIAIGKTSEEYLRTGIAAYLGRILHYVNIKLIELPAAKNTKSITEHMQKIKEGELLLRQVSGSDTLFLLDEKGKEYSSVEFAEFIQRQANRSVKNLVFAIGGPYGFSEEVKQKAQGRISLSRMTFSHQMVRLFFTEQLYRAFTILRGEAYHHL